MKEYSYYPPDYGIIHRAAMMAIACAWIDILFVLIPRKRIPWVTYCGKNIMSVFVPHGFLVRILDSEHGSCS